MKNNENYMKSNEKLNESFIESICFSSLFVVSLFCWGCSESLGRMVVSVSALPGPFQGESSRYARPGEKKVVLPSSGGTMMLDKCQDTSLPMVVVNTQAKDDEIIFIRGRRNMP